MEILLGSLALALLNCLSLYLISHHRARLGWRLTLAIQALWIPYDILTGQWGFLLISALTIGIALKSMKQVQGRPLDKQLADERHVNQQLKEKLERNGLWDSP